MTDGADKVAMPNGAINIRIFKGNLISGVLKDVQYKEDRPDRKLPRFRVGRYVDIPITYSFEN